MGTRCAGEKGKRLLNTTLTFFLQGSVWARSMCSAWLEVDWRPLLAGARSAAGLSHLRSNRSEAPWIFPDLGPWPARLACVLVGEPGGQEGGELRARIVGRNFVGHLRDGLASLFLPPLPPCFPKARLQTSGGPCHFGRGRRAGGQAGRQAANPPIAPPDRPKERSPPCGKGGSQPPERGQRDK